MRNWPVWAQGLCSLLLAALVWLVLACISLVTTAERVVSDLPPMITKIIERQGGELQATAAAESKAWRNMAERRLQSAQAAATATAAAESKAWRLMTAAELAQTRELAAGQIDRLAAKADAPSASLVALLDEYRSVPAVVGARLDPWTECRGNGACWQAQTTAALGAFRVTMGRTAIAMKGVSEAAPSIAKNVDRTADNIARLTKPASVGMQILKLASPIAGGAFFGAIK